MRYFFKIRRDEDECECLRNKKKKKKKRKKRNVVELATIKGSELLEGDLQQFVCIKTRSTNLQQELKEVFALLWDV